ncbi:MAG: hypothetical protein LBL77_02210 [Endomicrobium sp.]|jgi:putative FmdB family regulatory protein|nr:hypothetical protein [Endomicrobium sp.]
MPLFEFICKKCNEKFEVIVSNNEKLKCPKCKSTNMTKQFSKFATLKCSESKSCQPSLKDEHKCNNKCCCQ